MADGQMMKQATANGQQGRLLLKTDGMTKRFGGLVALDKLDLEVRQGQICSIIGPNGAGKTTVFNCIMNFYTPDDGSVVFDGERIDGVTARKSVANCAPSAISAVIGTPRAGASIRRIKSTACIRRVCRSGAIISRRVCL